MTPDGGEAPQSINPVANSTNCNIFALSCILIYLAAPVTYVGVVQAGLCAKLGASTAVANLPASMYLLGFLAPLIVAGVIPQRLERAAAIVANGLTSITLGLVALALIIPVGNKFRIATVVFQGCVIGISASVSQVYLLQCLSRGTTPEGKAKSFQLAFGFGPIAAVAGSLLAQYVLNGGIRTLRYPLDFALLYVFGSLCMAVAAISNFRFNLLPVPDLPHVPAQRRLVASIKSYASDRALLLMWFASLLWFSAIYATPNFSLYTKELLHRDPKDLSGVIMALRFACKSACGFFLARLSLRHGVRASVIAAVVITLAGTMWAWCVPGYPFLFAFGLMGAGELGGIYFPNYVVSISPFSAGASNQAVLALAQPAASFAPALHGFLTSHFGFRASFIFSTVASLMALAIMWQLPKRNEDANRTSAPSTK